MKINQSFTSITIHPAAVVPNTALNLFQKSRLWDMGWSLPFWLHHQHHSNNEKSATVNAKLIMKILRDLQLQFCKVLSFWMMNVKPTCATIAVIKNWRVWEKYGNRKVVSLFHSFDSQILASLRCKNSLFTASWAFTYYLSHLTYFLALFGKMIYLSESKFATLHDAKSWPYFR